jgi:hypothetical protein
MHALGFRLVSTLPTIWLPSESNDHNDRKQGVGHEVVQGIMYLP